MRRVVGCPWCCPWCWAWCSMFSRSASHCTMRQVASIGKRQANLAQRENEPHNKPNGLLSCNKRRPAEEKSPEVTTYQMSYHMHQVSLCKYSPPCAHECVHVYVCVHARVHLCVHVVVCICMCVCANAFVCVVVCVCMCVCMCVRVVVAVCADTPSGVLQPLPCRPSSCAGSPMASAAGMKHS